MYLVKQCSGYQISTKLVKRLPSQMDLRHQQSLTVPRPESLYLYTRRTTTRELIEYKGEEKRADHSLGIASGSHEYPW